MTAQTSTTEQLNNESRDPGQGVRVNDSARPVVAEEVGGNVVGEDTAPSTSSPEDYSAGIGLALQVEEASRPRTLQSQAGIFGASDAGQCERRAVWTVTQQPWTDLPKAGRAQSGIYLHEGLLNAVQALYPERLIESELTCTLPSGVRLTLHPDILDPTEPSATDLKTTESAAARGKSGPSAPQWMQVNLQYYAALQNGLFTTDEGRVRVLFVNSADLDDRYVWQQPFDMEWVHRADDWFQSVVYAVEQGEDGEAQWPENRCRSYCPFYSRCRPTPLDVTMPIPEGDLADMVRLGFQARANRKEWEKVEDHVMREIKGLSGTTVDGIQVKTTTVNRQTGSYQKVEMIEVAS